MGLCPALSSRAEDAQERPGQGGLEGSKSHLDPGFVVPWVPAKESQKDAWERGRPVTCRLQPLKDPPILDTAGISHPGQARELRSRLRGKARPQDR